MKICSFLFLFAAAAGLGVLSGCEHEDIEKQLDRRQVDTYENEVPVDPAEDSAIGTPPVE